MKDAANGFQWIFEISFVKHAMDGATISLFGWKRAKFNCYADYCHYRWPQKFIESIGMHEDFLRAVQALLFFLVFFRVTAFCIMNYRLKH